MARKFTATVKEGGPTETGGQAPVWVLIEPDEEIGLRQDENIVIDFAPGTPIETAEAVARSLNKNALSFKIRRF
jgi:hypothetical protein